MILPPLILIPGAWMGAWIWSLVVEELSAAGVGSHPITLTGLESDQFGNDADLETHIEDVRRFAEGLRTPQVIIVAHSYSGLVAGCFAARFPQIVRAVAMVEAYLPVDGECLLDTAGLNRETELRFVDGQLARWLPPTIEELSTQRGLDDESSRWLAERFVPHPSPSIIQPASLPSSSVQGVFIGGRPPLNKMKTRQFNLDYYHMDEGHWPMISKPKRLAHLLKQSLLNNLKNKAEQDGAQNAHPRQTSCCLFAPRTDRALGRCRGSRTLANKK